MRSKFSSTLTLSTLIVVAGALSLAREAQARFVDVRDIPAPIVATELLYSPNYATLILKSASNEISVVAIANASSVSRAPNYQFTDIALSPDGRYVLAADYGGESGSSPANQSYVHRLDLSDGSWTMRKAVIAGHVQATSSDSLVLKSLNQFVTFTNNSWGTGDTLIQLNANTPSNPGYFPGVYDGNFLYDQRTSRLIHGSSAGQISAFRVVGNDFVKQEDTSSAGSASGYGPNVALATDGSVFYYGRLCVDALDVIHNLRVFPEAIYAATGDVAFGGGNYYGAHSGAVMGSLGFTATVYGLNANGSDFWVYDATANLLRHFVWETEGGIEDAGSDQQTDGAAVDSGISDSPPSDADPTCSDAGASDGGAWRFVEVHRMPPPTNVVQLVYSPEYGRLAIKNTASAVSVVDVSRGSSAAHVANYRFTDISLSPDGRFVFAADYGGENIGYGTPLYQSYVHRVDLTDGSWSVRKAVIAGHVQATSGESVILKSRDQWVTFTNNAWGTGDTLVQLNTNTSPFVGYNPGVYSGNFRYDPRTARIIHGESDGYPAEIRAFKIVNDQFVKQEGTSRDASASGYGTNVALATDGSAFYFGRLSIDVRDVTRTQNVFPEVIYAATGAIAFGKDNFYSTKTGATLGTLGFAATVYALNPNGSDFWVFDAAAKLLRHFVLSVACGGDASTTVDASGTDTSLDAPPTSDVSDVSISDMTGNQDLSPRDGLTADTSVDTVAIDAMSDTPSSDASGPTDAAPGDGSSARDVSTVDASTTRDGESAEANPVADSPRWPDSARDASADSFGDASSSDSGDNPGCGCSVPRTRHGNPGLLTLLGLLIIGCWRREKRRSAQKH